MSEEYRSEKLLAESIKENTKEGSIAIISDQRSKSMIRDALALAEQELEKSERSSHNAIIRVLKDVLDNDGSLVIEGEDVNGIRKNLGDEDE